MEYKALLVEDEPIALDKIRRLLGGHKHKIEIIGEAVNGLEAVEKINQLKPDLVFLDIQMPGLTGFEVLSKLDYLPLIIFTTAYDEYALKAFEANTIDYLLKPISAEKLQKSLHKLDSFKQGGNWQQLMHNLMQQVTPNKPSRLAVNLADKIIFIDPEEIYFALADKKYTEIHLHHKKYILSKTLTELEGELGNNFVRLHRSNLVNKNRIGEVLKLSSRKWVVKLTDEAKTELPVSRDYQSRLF